jgi:hypothetical protein
MTADLGQRIRWLTETSPVSVAEVVRRSERRRRVPRALKVSAIVAVVTVLAATVFVASAAPPFCSLPPRGTWPAAAR